MPIAVAWHTAGVGAATGRVAVVAGRTRLTELTDIPLGALTQLHMADGVTSH